MIVMKLMECKENVSKEMQCYFSKHAWLHNFVNSLDMWPQLKPQHIIKMMITAMLPLDIFR